MALAGCTTLYPEQATDVRTAQTDRGTTVVYSFGPRVWGSRVTGHLDETGTELILDDLASRMRGSPGQFVTFHDWYEMSGYDSVCRQRLTSFFMSHRAAVAQCHLAVQSKLVAMGVQVANLALGGAITTYTKRSAFERVLRGVVQSH